MARSTIGFWLKDWDDVYLQLPVNPPEVSIESPFDINVVKIAALGEVSFSGERNLKRISFESFFPRDYNSSYCEYERLMAPEQWVAQIEKWRDTRKNIRLIITGTTISIPVYVTEFSYTPERAGEPGDIYYSISFVEYRPVQPKLLYTPTAPSKPTAAPAKQRPTEPKPLPKTYTVVKGDSLWKISKRVYKDGAQWRRIYDANKSVIGKNPNLIYPGQKLVIP